MKVIALGGRKCSGKTTIADELVLRCGATRVSFATPLKELCAQILNTDVVTLENWKNSSHTVYAEDVEGPKSLELIHLATGIPISSLQEVHMKYLATDVRGLLQFVGTDIIRKFKPLWHIQKTEEYIESLPENSTVVIDDLRFKNEKIAIETALEGDCFFVMRPLYDNASNHLSERNLSWRDFSSLDKIFVNIHSINKFYELIDRFIEHNTESVVYEPEEYTKLRALWTEALPRISMFNVFKQVADVPNIEQWYKNDLNIFIREEFKVLKGILS